MTLSLEVNYWQQSSYIYAIVNNNSTPFIVITLDNLFGIKKV